MTRPKASPLEPREFFSGIWRGEGELVPSRLLSWLVPQESVRFWGRPAWLSDAVSKVEESFEFSSGRIIERTMFVEIVAPDRLHVRADDMPLGADLALDEGGFHFSPYSILVDYGGRRWRLQCLDDNRLDENGVIHDRIEMFFGGVRVAEMRLTVSVER